MTEQFVTYDIAVKLKEIGFDQPCIAGYQCKVPTLFSEIPHTLVGNIHKNSDGRFTCAPIWQQVIDWFWDKYKFDISTKFGYGWEFEIWYDKAIILTDGTYNTRTEAIHDAILGAIELI